MFNHKNIIRHYMTILCLLAVSCMMACTAAAGELKAYFLDVGQADATLFVADGHSLLVDAGDTFTDGAVVSMIQSLGVDHLDAIIFTHPHKDHIGGGARVLSYISADRVYRMNQGYDANDTAIGITQVMNLEQIPETEPKPGTEVKIGEMKVHFIGPTWHNPDFVNDNSIVAKVSYGDISVLMCGDAERDEEMEMVRGGEDLKCTVMKSPHHGSNSSSTYSFLRAAMPQVVVISVGKDNQYGLPSDNALSRYRDLGADIYRTDESGTIILTTDGKTMSWSASVMSTVQKIVATNASGAASNVTRSTGADSSSVTFIGNKNSKKLHLSTCKSLPAKSNQVMFDSCQEGLSAGYVPCKNCNPQLYNPGN